MKRMLKENLKIKIFNHLNTKKVAMTKKSLMKELELTKNQVDRGCRELRKDRVVGRYMGKWWRLR